MRRASGAASAAAGAVLCVPYYCLPKVLATRTQGRTRESRVEMGNQAGGPRRPNWISHGEPGQAMELASGHLTVKPAVRRRRPSHRQPIDVAVRGQGAATEQRPTFHHQTWPTEPRMSINARVVFRSTGLLSPVWSYMYMYSMCIFMAVGGGGLPKRTDGVWARVCGAVESTVAEPSSAFRLDAPVTREHDGCCHWGRSKYRYTRIILESLIFWL